MPSAALALLPLILAADPPPAAVPGLPPAIQRLVERELAKPLPAKAFSTPGGARGKVEAAGEVAIVPGEEGRELLTIPIGTDQAVGCSIIPERIDAGGSLHLLTQKVAEAVQLAAVRTTEVQVVEGSALLHFEVLYTKDSEKGKLVGGLKVAILVHETHSLVCQHDELGYAKSFQRLVRGLAASLRDGRDDGRTRARFAEVQVLQLGPVTVGFEERLIGEAEGGGRSQLSHSALVLPRTPSEYVAVDTVRREEVDAEGQLSKGIYVQVMNGQVETSVTVTRDPESKDFAYRGTKGGKEISGRFAAPGGLATELWFARRFDRKHGAGPQEPLKRPAYLFEADPTGPLEMTYRRDPARPGRVEIEAGPLRLSGELDDAGLLTATDMPVGPAVMRSRRAWSRGSP